MAEYLPFGRYDTLFGLTPTMGTRVGGHRGIGVQIVAVRQERFAAFGGLRPTRAKSRVGGDASELARVTLGRKTCAQASDPRRS